MKKYRRLKFILFVMACLSLSAGLALYALKDNISYFRTPGEARAMVAGHEFRLGGLVKEGSIARRGGLKVEFVVTDLKDEMAVVYDGILPDLFREKQGVIATGAMGGDGVFIARELLAKHDENYMPPEVAKALEKNKP